MNRIKNKLPVIIGLLFLAAALAAVIIFFAVGGSGGRGYRLVQLYELGDGDATITRASKGEMEPYLNMMLQSGDVITTGPSCYLQLRLDDDKYVLVEPDTVLKLEATGSKTDSRTILTLEKGAIVNELKNALSANSVYEVNTPNSTMAVRGTSFRVTLVFDDEGVSHVVLSVCNGSVSCKLIYPDGSESEEEAVFEEGTEAAIFGDSSTSDYEYTDGTVDYEEMKYQVLSFLDKYFDLGKELTITRIELEELMNQRPEYTVTFMYDGKPFAQQTVTEENTAHAPKLSPSLSGGWDFDFSEIITEDTVIYWSSTASSAS